MSESENLIDSGIDLHNQGKYKEAIDKYDEYLKSSPESIEALFNKGLSLQSLSQNEEALQIFDLVLKQDPTYVPALIAKALCYCFDNFKDAAIKYFDEALKIDPNNKDALINKSILLYQNENYPEAKEAINKVIESEPENFLPYFILGNINKKLDLDQEAIENYKKSLEKNPEKKNLEEIYCNLGICYSDMDENEDSAKENIEKCLELNPNRIEALLCKASFLFSEEKFNEAIEIYDKILSIDANNEKAILNKGKCLEKLEKIEEAENLYDKILDKNPEAKLSKAKILADNETEEDLQEAEKIVDEVMASQEEENEKTLFLKGYISSLKGDYKTAENFYEKCNQIEPGNYLTLYNYGISLLNEKKVPESKNYILQSKQINPNFYKNSIALAKIALIEKKPEEALTLIDEILTNEPDNEEALLTKGFTMISLKKNDDKNYDEIIQLFNNVLKENQESDEALVGLGICYHKMGDEKQALRFYDKALMVNDENDLAYYNKSILLFNKEGEKKKVSNALEKIKTKNEDILCAQGTFFLKNQNYENGLACFDNALKLNEKSEKAHIGKGQCLFGQDKIDEAINEYDLALEINPNNPNALNSKANALDKQGKQDEALELYVKACEGSDNNTLVLINLAICYYERKNYKESEETLAKAEKLYEEQKGGNMFNNSEKKNIEKSIEELHKELSKNLQSLD